MGWSTVPLSAGDAGVIAAMTEVKAAFDERYDAVGASFGKPTAVTADDFGDWSDVIAHYHTKIESLLTSFYQKSGSGESTTFAAYTKSSLLTECFSQTEWRDTAAGLATIRQVNDLRTALNKLTWSRFSVNVSAGEYKKKECTDTLGYGVWDDCKTDAWSALASDTASTASSASALQGGHVGAGELYEGNYDINASSLQYLYDSQVGFDTSSMSGVTLADGYITCQYRLTPDDQYGRGVGTTEACSCNLLYDTETIKSSLSVSSTTFASAAYRISSPDARTNKSGNTILYLTLNNPGDDVTDRESSWPAPTAAGPYVNFSGYSRQADIRTLYLYLQAQFSYRA